MSDIASFKVIYVDLWNGEGSLGGSTDEKNGIKGYERIPDFITKVNLYIANGYTLHGTTLNVSTGLITNHRFSQALIRYPNKHGPIITEYILVYACSSGKIRQMNGEITERSTNHNDFEEKIFNLLQNGWCLFGDLQSCYSRTATSNYNGEHQYSQVLVKYKQSDT
jgi:hypothetical protein